MSRHVLLSSYMFKRHILDMKYEVRLHGSEISKETVRLSVHKSDQLLKEWELPVKHDSRNLKHAMRSVALQYFWDCPGKNLSAGRPDYEAYTALEYIYNDMCDEDLGSWMETNSYEYEFEAECAVGKHVLPVLVTAICDGPWFRLTTRFKLHNDIKHQSDDLTLTRDYSSGMTTTLAELLAKLGNDNAALITAACKVNAPEPAPYDYTGIANKTFGYVKKP